MIAFSGTQPQLLATNRSIASPKPQPKQMSGVKKFLATLLRSLAAPPA